jgi:zinc protease
MKRPLLAALCILAAAHSAGILAAPLPGLSHFKLSNGLEVFAYQDRALPLARIQLVYKAGAMAQTADNAGLFRLYERLVFDGEPGLPGSAALRDGLDRLGLSAFEGGTGLERISYSITAPSNRLVEAAALLATIAAPPLIEPETLERHRAALLGELAALPDGDSVYEAAIAKRLFGKFPWRRDLAGSEKAIRGATAEALRALGRTWFVPGNAAVLVGGDLEPEAARAAVERAFGSWKAGEDPWKRPPLPHPKPGVVRPTWIVYPDPTIPEGLASVEARYRGPDSLADPAATHGGDLWSALVEAPEGRFKSALAKAVPRLYGTDSISASYYTQRDGALISISAFFYVDPSLPAADRVRLFKERARGFEITAMRTDPSYYSSKDYETARRRLLGDRDLALDGPDGVLDALAFWWSSASIEYFLGYPEAIAATGPREVGVFLDQFIMRNLEVVALRMNPADFERERASLEGAGFETVKKTNAFWWQR